MTSRPIVRPASTRALTTVLGFWAVYLALVVGARIVPPVLPARVVQLAWAVVIGAALFLLTRALVRREGRTLGEVGIGLGPRTVPRFLVGAVIGFATYALNVGVVAATVGGLRLTPAGAIDWSSVALTLATLLALSCMEELGFRGYPLRTLVPRIGLWPAQALVAVGFALTHLVYGWSWDSVVFGVLPSAFLFGAAALASGGLAMPIGLHMAVNAARWAFGERGNAGLFTMAIDHSAAGRIERVAPVTGIAITLAMAAILWWWSHREGAPEVPARTSPAR